VTVGVVEVGVVDTRYGVSQPEADAERYRCACLHCTQGLAGRGDGYQCGLDLGRSSSIFKAKVSEKVLRSTGLCNEQGRHVPMAPQGQEGLHPWTSLDDFNTQIPTCGVQRNSKIILRHKKTTKHTNTQMKRQDVS